jgi:hypothetical protein
LARCGEAAALACAGVYGTREATEYIVAADEPGPAATLLPFPPPGDEDGWKAWWSSWRARHAGVPSAALVPDLVSNDWPGDHTLSDLPPGVVLLGSVVDEVLGRLLRQREGGRP